MTDLLQFVVWGGIFVVGIVGCVVICVLNLTTTYIHNLLHIKTSI